MRRNCPPIPAAHFVLPLLILLLTACLLGACDRSGEGETAATEQVPAAIQRSAAAVSRVSAWLNSPRWYRIAITGSASTINATAAGVATNRARPRAWT